MDPTYTEEAEAFRTRIKDFLDANLPPGWAGYGAMSVEDAFEWTADWRQKLAANGLLARRGRPNTAAVACRNSSR